MNKLIMSLFLSLAFFACEENEFKPQTIEEEIEKIAYPYLISGDRLGIAIGTYDNGTERFYSYGVKNIKNGGSIDINTIFEIGSISKTFTATAVASMHLNGELNLTDEVESFFEGKVNFTEPGNRKIELLHLANHTSALPREPNNINSQNSEQIFNDYSINDFYDFANNYELSRIVGSQCEYSNLGMGILGYILKEQRNTSYYELVQAEILSKLEMNVTSLRFGDTNTDNIAFGYVGNEPKGEMEFSEVFEGAGVLVSNMSDMMKYLKAQFSDTGSLLSQAIQLTHQKTSESDIEDNGIGLSWYLTELSDGQNIIWHNGGTIGYSSFIGFNKNTRKGVVVLMNSRNNYNTGEVNMGYEILKALNKY